MTRQNQHETRSSGVPEHHIPEDLEQQPVEISAGIKIDRQRYVSVRVDILPCEVANELIGLRDEIPAEQSAAIIRQIEQDFARPITKIFEWFSPMPLGAASLGQVHLARVAENHNEVVVKVLRPGIDILVETDSAAISLAIGWLKRYRRSLPPRTSPMENVSYIKVSDFPKISSTGINPADVAKKIYNFYLQQIFETHFVHADPHPDNIFIKPLPTKTERDPGNNEIRPGDLVEYQRDRPFLAGFCRFWYGH